MQILPKDPKDRKYALLGLKITGDFGASLAVPAVVCVLIAQWLAKKYGFDFWIIILALCISGVFSGYSIVKKAKKYGKVYQDIDKEE